jgi:hypothetical protein
MAIDGKEQSPPPELIDIPTAAARLGRWKKLRAGDVQAGSSRCLFGG